MRAPSPDPSPDPNRDPSPRAARRRRAAGPACAPIPAAAPAARPGAVRTVRAAAGLLGLALLASRPAAADETAPPPGAAPQQPAAVEMRLGAEDLRWIPERQRHAVTRALPETASAPIPPLKKSAPAHRQAARSALNRLISSGRAAGFSGLLYDNRDADHSSLDPADYPGLVFVEYAGDLREKRLNYGLAETMLFPAITVGNSSTAFKRGRAPRSLPRDAMVRQGAAAQAFQGYLSNQIYVYPEHRDHDRVDRYPANWPYMIVSQGSSYQDRPFVQAALWVLAAMRPETRAYLEREGLAAPVVQTILRRSQRHVRTASAYLTGAAHPTVFDQDAIRLDRAVALAQALTPETVPPVALIEVLSDAFGTSAGLAGMSERLFDTPGAVARVWRGWEWEKEMVLSAATVPTSGGTGGGADGGTGGGVAFDWVVLRGDPDRVRITPLEADGSRARIAVAWHAPRPISPRTGRTSARVDIGVFARRAGTRGLAESASPRGQMQAHMHGPPAMLSISFPAHQSRVYAEAPGGGRRLMEIDYRAAGEGADPLLHWQAPWRDVFVYEGRTLRGWERHAGPDEVILRYAADGTGPDGQKPAYRLARRQNGFTLLPEFAAEAASERP